jgi:hypothetical protein
VVTISDTLGPGAVASVRPPIPMSISLPAPGSSVTLAVGVMHTFWSEPYGWHFQSVAVKVSLSISAAGSPSGLRSR